MLRETGRGRSFDLNIIGLLEDHLKSKDDDSTNIMDGRNEKTKSVTKTHSTWLTFSYYKRRAVERQEKGQCRLSDDRVLRILNVLDLTGRAIEFEVIEI